MDQTNNFMEYPTIFIPKRCTPLETNSDIEDNVLIDLNITSRDNEGNNTLIYSGFCDVKLTDSDIPEESTDIEQMPVILAEANPFQYNDSQVWIDPSRSPFVYNHYDMPQTHTYESQNITVEHHNTYITQNVYNYKDQSPVRRRVNEPIYYNEEEFECGVTLSKLPEKYDNENNALKQLMSTESGSVQRKTILFLGHDSDSGQTIQNISFNDPKIQCATLEINNNGAGSSPPTNPPKKKYQCDKCKQIFDQISDFRQHMVIKHYNYKTKEMFSFICMECGKKLKTKSKFEQHCSGHGDPDLECSKCHKVFASNITLRNHEKIHNRKFSCEFCTRTYGKAEQFRTHLEKSHSRTLCHYDNCTYVANGQDMKKHEKEHERGFYFDDDPIGEVIVITEDDFKPESLDEENQDEYGNTDSVMTDDDDNEFKIGNENDKIETDSKVTAKKILFNDDFSSVIEEEYLKEVKKTGDSEKIKNADSVIAKVMSNKIFLLNSKNAKKHGKYIKSCDVCYKRFDRIGDLKRHLIEHIIRSTLAKTPVSKNGTLKILCEVCQNEVFSRIDKYKQHLREHAKLTLYKCTFCDKSFSDSSNFSKHKKIHGVPHFQCDMCQRKFSSKKMISKHMEYHMKNKPVSCKYCNKKFHFPSMLNKHMKCTHRSPSAKFHCKFCDNISDTLKQKWEHEWNVHRVRKMVVDCLICQSKFRKYTELKRHCYDLHRVSIPPVKQILKNKKR